MGLFMIFGRTKCLPLSLLAALPFWFAISGCYSTKLVDERTEFIPGLASRKTMQRLNLSGSPTPGNPIMHLRLSEDEVCDEVEARMGTELKIWHRTPTAASLVSAGLLAIYGGVYLYRDTKDKDDASAIYTGPISVLLVLAGATGVIGGMIVPFVSDYGSVDRRWTFESWQPTGTIDTTYTGRIGTKRLISSASLRSMPISVECGRHQQSYLTDDDGSFDVDMFADFGFAEFSSPDTLWLDVLWNGGESHARVPFDPRACSNMRFRVGADSCSIQTEDQGRLVTLYLAHAGEEFPVLNVADDLIKVSLGDTDGFMPRSAGKLVWRMIALSKGSN